MEENGSFYKDRYFEQLSKQIADLQENVANLETKIDDIKSKVVYMYGFAAAIGLGGSLAINWIRSHIMGS